ncbi:MAG: FtsK/SpoIIIE domain-containing protein [Phycisphaerae bacterium]
MTQFAPSPEAPSRNPATAPQDTQRETLEQIVNLSIQCSTTEQRIDQEHDAALARATQELQKQLRAADDRAQHRTAELTASTTHREESIQLRYESRKHEIDSENESQESQIVRQRRDAESALKKEYEAATWQAESTLVQFQMKIDAEEQNWSKIEEQSKADLASLDALEASANRSLARCGLPPAPAAAPPALDDPTKQKLAADRLPLLEDQRTLATKLLNQLRSITQPRATDALVPWFFIILGTGCAAFAAWTFTTDDKSRPLYTAIAGGALLLLGTILWFLFRARRRAHVRNQAQSVYASFLSTLAIAREAARVDSEAAAADRQRRVNDAKRRRDAEATAAREKAKSIQLLANNRYQSDLADLTQHTSELAAANQKERDTAIAELHQSRDATQSEIDTEHSSARHEAEAAHAKTRETIESTYTTETRNLTALWDDGLQRVNALLAAGAGIDPALIDWQSPAWAGWKSPREFTGQIRFGEMTVDLTQLTQTLPKRLQLPQPFKVPALLTLPTRGSLFIESDQTGRHAVNDLAKLVIARLLTQIPAGRAKFTIFDPAGLGQNFAGFMHLTDHDESLVGARIWTEKEHIQQRLADLTEHMETVIQKYLRNEYTTIDQYNAQAGELAEPYRFLVIADFPTGFEPETLRRLTSIAETGPRCGVYTIILRDTRLPLPQGSRVEDIIQRSVHLQYKNGNFTWNDAVFRQFPLRADAPSDDKTLTALMDKVGLAAKEAKRVEVPFESIAPAPDHFWSRSSAEDLRVPIGKSGATRLQSLRLGIGVAQHMLVAGKTGSGKSNLMHTIVTNMAMWYSPDELEFYLVDFKKGVEFKAYASTRLPHARAIAVESDREFGLSVLQRVDAELTRRGTMFRDVGAQEIRAFRDKTGQKLPRTVLLIDEFQEFFSEDDKVAQEASGLLDRLVRQGRAFGVHVVLGSQTIGGSSGLARSTLGQIAVRIALQCSEADSQMILGDNNSAARLLSRPGEAVYNDAGGLVEANSPFQIAFLPDEQRERYLEKIRDLADQKSLHTPDPIVFEGNTAASIRGNRKLLALLNHPLSATPSLIPAYVGEPVAIKDPAAVLFRRQIGANVLLVGQQEESAIAIFSSIITSLAAQHRPGDAFFHLLDGTPADSRYFGLLERVLQTIPQQSKIIQLKQVPDAINELSTLLKDREADDSAPAPAIYTLLFGLQRFRVLRRAEDDFSFRSSESETPKTDKQFAELLSEGPAAGIHNLLWADTPITIERTLERSAMKHFDYRILFQMSATDSSNLIDSPLANNLGAHRALLYSEEQGTTEKFRPYEVPTHEWLTHIAAHLTPKSQPA